MIAINTKNIQNNKWLFNRPFQYQHNNQYYRTIEIIYLGSQSNVDSVTLQNKQQ